MAATGRSVVHDGVSHAVLADSPYTQEQELKINISVKGVMLSDLKNAEKFAGDPFDRVQLVAKGYVCKPPSTCGTAPRHASHLLWMCLVWKHSQCMGPP